MIVREKHEFVREKLQNSREKPQNWLRKGQKYSKGKEMRQNAFTPGIY